MGKLFQCKLNQLKRYQNRLDELEADCKAIASDIGCENNRANRQRLQRRETELVKEMEEVAQHYDGLEKELQKFPEYKELQEKEQALQFIITLLTDISLDKVINAYRSCLPEARPPKDSETQEKLVRRLAEMPEGNDGLTPLVRLVYYLSQDKSLEKYQQSLLIWAKAQGLPSEMLDSKKEQNQTNTVETCLMVKVKPRSLNDSSKGYLLNATLFIDSNPLDVQLVDPIVIPIAVPAPSNPNSPAHSQDELEIVLGELINICGAEHGIALTDLTVQLFLPIELMSLPIEHGQLPRGKQCCGQRCKAVLIRSYERHFSEFYQSAKGDWKKYWNRFLEFREATCTETLTLLNPVKRKTKIQGGKPRVLGCRFIEHHDQQQQEDFWDKILSQGLPIAFWIRHLGMTSQEAKKVMGSVTRKCSVGQLPESLTNKRQQILSQEYESESEQLKKAPLCLLWDNPFRPFPSINYQSE